MSEEFIRPDGRKRKEMRDLNIEVGILDRADGSAKVHLGKNIAIATVFGPRELHPRHLSRASEALLRINYRMATFSVVDYKRPFPSRREKEISKVLTEAFESVVLTKLWPRSAIDVHVQIFQSDGGTRTAAAIAVSAALADAGIPMRDLTGAIASGIYEDEVCLDLCGIEDMKGTGDMPILYSPNVDEISLFQLDGMFTFEQFKEAFELSLSTIPLITEKIKETLRNKYLAIKNEIIGDDIDKEDEIHASRIVKDMLIEDNYEEPSETPEIIITDEMAVSEEKTSIVPEIKAEETENKEEIEALIIDDNSTEFSDEELSAVFTDEDEETSKFEHYFDENPDIDIDDLSDIGDTAIIEDNEEKDKDVNDELWFVDTEIEEPRPPITAIDNNPDVEIESIERDIEYSEDEE